MADIELSEIRSDLLSIEELIEALLHRQAQLTSRLWLASPEPVVNRIPFTMEPPSVGTDSADPPNTSPTWAVVVRGKRRVSIPLFPDPLEDEDTLPLSNFFDPLAELEVGVPPSPRPFQRRRYIIISPGQCKAC
ncbi:hypothetical protein AAFF_G00429900 [Aldrovandia affinis]|uniref:Uncharacterized protein n=1 Tax=Aldrovandia affinis TaxID=143900 RepID=A0AAD7S8U5_9TELE|nr:hypothetical protein AAFF_G00429900 [Aldrovandia affinis]